MKHRYYYFNYLFYKISETEFILCSNWIMSMVLTNIGNYNKSSSAIFKDIGISTLTFYFFSPVYRIFGKSFLLDRLTIMKSVNIRFFHIQKSHFSYSFKMCGG